MVTYRTKTKGEHMGFRLHVKNMPRRFYGLKDNECLITPNLLKKFGRFLVRFIPVYISCVLFGYYYIGHSKIADYFSLTFIITLLSFFSFVWDSELLKGFIWSALPAFWIFFFYWLVCWFATFPYPDPKITQKLFVNHLPMLLLFSFFMLKVKTGKTVKWWIVSTSAFIIIFYLSILRVIDQQIPSANFNFYHGFFPYEWPVTPIMIFLGGTISSLFFFKLEKKHKEKDDSPIT